MGGRPRNIHRGKGGTGSGKARTGRQRVRAEESKHGSDNEVTHAVSASLGEVSFQTISSGTNEESRPSHELTPAPQQAIGAGDRIANRYDVLSVLGEGGMGIVFACHDSITGTRIALKQVILPEGKLRSDYITWFYKEARALAALDHPGIVRAHDFGQLADRSPYLAMQLVTGHSLHDLSYGRLAFPLIWSITQQILSALAHAHSHRVIHGDLKPSNVIVREGDGEPPRVYILDFGLAWLKRDPHDERLDGAKAMEFSPHAGAGTPGYMAPEQIMHEMHHVEDGTDLYSLGCILYKLIGGKAPWSGDSKDLLKWHAYEPAPILEPIIDVPNGVVEFVMRLLRKRPWERYEFAAEAARVWDTLRPAEPLAPSVWQFPKVRASQTATVSSAPPVSPAKVAVHERATGLLSIRPSPLVGREDIRHILDNVCHDVINDRATPHRLALLLGPAGVGKSRIAEWLCAKVHEEGSMVPLVAKYRKVRGTLDGMLGAVVQHYNFEQADRDTIEQSLMARWSVDPEDRRMRTWVAGTAEWLRPTPPGEEYVGPSGIRFTIDTLNVRRQIIRFVLRRIANRRPLLFFLDDLHNAPSSTIEGLLRIHDKEQDQRIFMLATVRTEDVRLGTDVAARLRELRQVLSGDVVEVSPMDREMTCELLRASLPLDREAVLEAARRSRGFPLFALQQLHAWANAGEMQLYEGQYRVSRDVLAVRPKTTADLWESRVNALPSKYAEAAYAVAPLGIDIRRTVVVSVLEALNIPAEGAIVGLQKAELILPRDQTRYSWPHALLQEYLLEKLGRRPDAKRFFIAAARALEQHPLANTRRIVRQRVVNLLNAGEAEVAAETFFGFLERSWNGARQPAATLADLELFQGRLSGRMRALESRWRAEALRHAGNTEEARGLAEQALEDLQRHGNEIDVAHCQRLLGHLISSLGSAQDGLDLVENAHTTFTAKANILGMALCESVIAEIEYLVGNYGRAQQVAHQGERNFAAIHHSMGRGSCLLLLSWVAHSEGATARSRRLTLEAQGEFERTGYRLGIAQTTASLAHIEHRLANFFNAHSGAQEALGMFGALHTLRGQAACERLLAMVGVDTEDLDAAQLHATRAEELYREMGDPWGMVEARLLLAQICLAHRNPEGAREHLYAAEAISVSEPEPKQHALLTEAWFELKFGNPRQASQFLHKASEVFDERWQVGDHTPHLLARLAHMDWPDSAALELIESWRAEVDDHVRRDRD